MLKRPILVSGFILCLFISFVVTDLAVSASGDAAQVQSVSSHDDNDNTFTYSPLGRRDPFAPLIQAKEIVVKSSSRRPRKIKGPLEKFELSQYRLLAIMVVKGVPRAMVQAPDGKSYTVKESDYIGMNDGRVARIETKVVEVDSSGMRVEKSPDRIVVEEFGIDGLSGQEVKENRYIVM